MKVHTFNCRGNKLLAGSGYQHSKPALPPRQTIPPLRTVPPAGNKCSNAGAYGVISHSNRPLHSLLLLSPTPYSFLLPPLCLLPPPSFITPRFHLLFLSSYFSPPSSSSLSFSPFPLLLLLLTLLLSSSASPFLLFFFFSSPSFPPCMYPSDGQSLLRLQKTKKPLLHNQMLSLRV